MKKSILLFICLLSTTFTIAQINHPGQPLSWTFNIDAVVPALTMPSLDLETLRSEDEVNDQIKESPYRFGLDHQVSFNYFEKAMETSDGKNNIYQMAISCPEALSVSLVFDEFYIPKGGSLFVYSEDRSELKGAFTHRSNKDSGIFPVGLIKGQKIILEYNGPIEGAKLHVGEVTQGYRNVLTKWDPSRGPFGEGDPCHLNVNCEEASGWQDQKR